MEIVSFSSSSDFYDQLLSILSFLHYVGKPVSWTIYSDGSHSTKEIDFISTHFSFIKIIKLEWNNPESLSTICKEQLVPYLPYLLDYTTKSPYGKKMYAYLNYNVQRPTLFLDSDVLFYTKASQFRMIISEDVSGWYLPDFIWSCLDSRYKSKYSGQPYQVNAGFFLLNHELKNIKEGMEFLQSLEFNYENFSEQTVFHILLRSNHFFPFDPRIFILNSGDQFDFSYKTKKSSMAMRHYTGPVRHKMWQKNWKWHLSRV